MSYFSDEYHARLAKQDMERTNLRNALTDYVVNSELSVADIATKWGYNPAYFWSLAKKFVKPECMRTASGLRRQTEPASDVARKILELYSNGMGGKPVDIASTLGVSRQYVHSVLGRYILDPAE